MKISLFVIVSLAVLSLFGQNTNDLYMPREYKQAYNNESRSHDGIVGENYFQNKTDYEIKAELFPDTKLLIGNEIITYSNNSKDTLSWIYINLFQNLYKKRRSERFVYGCKKHSQRS
jgi:hypothetical protein